MRLNRVLLLAATVNIMIFALVFTISCSNGDDGKDGRPGSACVVDGDWNIVCNNVEIGKLEGKAGKDGQPGRNGTDGTGCWIGSKTDEGGYEIFCGAADAGELKGIINGCVSKDLGKYEVGITCGTVKINMCLGKLFDSEENYCDEVSKSIKPLPSSYTKKCGKVEYDTRKQYCGFSETDDPSSSSGTTIYDLCGGTENKTVLVKQPNEDSWDDEYCRWTSDTTAIVGKPATVAADTCDGLPLNKDSWKGEYCGYKSNTAVKKTVVTGICDRMGKTAAGTLPVAWYQGPNERAFGQGYCEVKYDDRKSGKTTYSEDLCGTSSNNKPNNGKWNAEYCGYTSVKSAVWDKIYKPICDDGYGPSRLKVVSSLSGGVVDSIIRKDYCAYTPDGTTELDLFCGDNGKPNASKWNRDYCGLSKDNPDPANDKVLYTNGLCDSGPFSYYKENGPNTAAAFATKTTAAGSDPGPTKSNFWNGYCKWNTITEKTELTLYADTCGVEGTGSKRPNSGKWNKEYCGYASQDALGIKGAGVALYDGTTDPTSVLYNRTVYINQVLKNDACEDGTGPSDGEENKILPIKADGSLDAAVTIKGQTINSNNYCAIVNLAKQGVKVIPSKKTTAVGPCGNSDKPNSGSWKNEYCGYNSMTSGLSIQKGLCGDGNGPNQAQDATYGGYCQWKSADATYTTFVPKNDLTGGYCGDGSTMAKFNELVWKNEYCFSDKKVATCPGGRVGLIYTMKSTDPVNDRCPTKASACSWDKASQCASDAGCTNINGPGLCSSGGCYAWDAAEVGSVKCKPTNKFRCNTYNGFTDNSGTYQGVWTPGAVGTSGNAFNDNPNNTGTCTDPTLTTTLLCTATGDGPTDALNGLGGWKYDRVFAETRECTKTGVSGVGIGSCPTTTGAASGDPNEADEWTTTAGQCTWPGACSAVTGITGGTDVTIGTCKDENAAYATSCPEIASKEGARHITEGTCNWTNVSGAALTACPATVTSGSGSRNFVTTTGTCNYTAVAPNACTTAQGSVGATVSGTCEKAAPTPGGATIDAKCGGVAGTFTDFSPTAGTCTVAAPTPAAAGEECNGLVLTGNENPSFAFEATAGQCTYADTGDDDDPCSITTGDLAGTIQDNKCITTSTAVSKTDCDSKSGELTTVTAGTCTVASVAATAATDALRCAGLTTPTFTATAGTCSVLSTDPTDASGDGECDGTDLVGTTFHIATAVCTKTLSSSSTGTGITSANCETIGGSAAASLTSTIIRCTETGVDASAVTQQSSTNLNALCSTNPATVAPGQQSVKSLVPTKSECTWVGVTGTQCNNGTATASVTDIEADGTDTPRTAACQKTDATYLSLSVCDGLKSGSNSWTPTAGTCTWNDKIQSICEGTGPTGLTGTWDATTASSKTTCTVRNWTLVP
ncbi:MAG: hypothetical protein LBC75_08500 [Fibromonadaceae bacterium]|nr:hypothetical protein [Fibromonadaceae bacterium]